MSLQRIMPWLVAALAASVAAMWHGARIDGRSLATAAAALAGLALVGVGLLVNAPLWRLADERVRPEALPVQARRNTRLLALAYGWGAAGMFAVYFLSGLRWWHGWQYGTLMALFAAMLLAYAHALGIEGSPWRAARVQRAALTLTVVQAALALAGVAWLVLSGKAASARSDWAANRIFVAGGLAVAALSIIAVLTKRRLQGALKRQQR
jgi:hypothetical protein